MSKNILKQSVCYVNGEGELLLLFDEGYLPFKNLDEALESTQRRLAYLMDETNSFFRTTAASPKSGAKRVLFLLSQVSEDFNIKQSLACRLEIIKDIFFEMLKEMEATKIYYKRNGDNSKLIERIVQIRNKLISIYVQLEKMVKMKSVNCNVLRKVDDYLQLCEQELTTFISMGKEMDGYAINRIRKKIINCKYELKSAYYVDPYRKSFNKIFNTLELSGDLEENIKKSNPQKLYRQVKEARTLL